MSRNTQILIYGQDSSGEIQAWMDKSDVAANMKTHFSKGVL